MVYYRPPWDTPTGELEVQIYAVQQSEVETGGQVASAIGDRNDSLHADAQLPHRVLVQRQLVDRVLHRGAFRDHRYRLRPRGDHQGHPIPASNQACTKLAGTGQTADHRPPR